MSEIRRLSVKDHTKSKKVICLTGLDNFFIDKQFNCKLLFLCTSLVILPLLLFIVYRYLFSFIYLNFSFRKEEEEEKGQEGR
jgi:hypothetical protein